MNDANTFFSTETLFLKKYCSFLHVGALTVIIIQLCGQASSNGVVGILTSIIMKLPQRSHGGTPGQARGLRCHLFRGGIRRPTKGKLTLVRFVIGFHGQGQAHLIGKKVLRRNFATIDTDGGTSAFFQEATPLHQQTLTDALHATVHRHGIDFAFAH